ncbi:uncharacterized protein K452DRAFT_171504 [Aplosporella prunicola CBS 121167]|uniref:Uncharacterized protein n=1 Tax=Aplosporella prunicola CBS 121167 TaxID=1176127 RepID=A0A6A6BJG2_9PEZI|nr:uncharacterized protein K452DRAFT_171504 [Aplosporella prunicola CBS 121167]KAF2143465.1 hypothetical protein K452DRAFT_171504 [Aplosporella prunicola CBS 121167]
MKKEKKKEKGSHGSGPRPQRREERDVTQACLVSASWAGGSQRRMRQPRLRSGQSVTPARGVVRAREQGSTMTSVSASGLGFGGAAAGAVPACVRRGVWWWWMRWAGVMVREEGVSVVCTYWTYCGRRERERIRVGTSRDRGRGDASGRVGVRQGTL